MTNYVSGRQKKSKAFNKRERELLNAIKNRYSEDKLCTLAEKLRESKIQAITVSEFSPSLSSEEVWRRRDLLIQKWKCYSAENIMTMYINKSKANKTDEK